MKLTKSYKKVAENIIKENSVKKFSDTESGNPYHDTETGKFGEGENKENDSKKLSQQNFNEAVRKARKRCLGYEERTGCERMFIINKSGDPLWIEDGKKFNVFFTPEIIKFLNESESNSLYLTHNHPNYCSFSIQDISVLLNNESIFGIEATNKHGTTFTCFKNNKNNYEADMNRLMTLHARLDNRLKSYIYEYLFLNDLTKLLEDDVFVEKINILHSHIIMENLTDLLKLEYRCEDTNGFFEKCVDYMGQNNFNSIKERFNKKIEEIKHELLNV